MKMRARKTIVPSDRRPDNVREEIVHASASLRAMTSLRRRRNGGPDIRRASSQASHRCPGGSKAPGDPVGQRLHHSRNTGMIGLRDRRRIDRRRPIPRTGRSTPPIVATPLMLSQARLSLFGPRVREFIRTTSTPPFGVKRPDSASASWRGSSCSTQVAVGSPVLARSGVMSTWI